MDDDSGKLGEVVELFSDITLPLKVDKLVKVSSPSKEPYGENRSSTLCIAVSVYIPSYQDTLK